MGVSDDTSFIDRDGGIRSMTDFRIIFAVDKFNKSNTFTGFHSFFSESGSPRKAKQTRPDTAVCQRLTS